MKELKVLQQHYWKTWKIKDFYGTVFFINNQSATAILRQRILVTFLESSTEGVYFTTNSQECICTELYECLLRNSNQILSTCFPDKLPITYSAFSSHNIHFASAYVSLRFYWNIGHLFRWLTFSKNCQEYDTLKIFTNHSKTYSYAWKLIS